MVLASEVYPPRAGGAGWSARALALGLRAAGHEVSLVTTSPGPVLLDGIAVERLTVRGRKRLAVPRAFAAALARHAGAVVHAQHSLSALGSLAGDSPHKVAVTVRDHWPVCFWSTRISEGALCAACGTAPMSRCVRGRVRAPAPLSWAAVPYMKGDLLLKRRALRRAGATLAVSDAIAAELAAAGIPRVEVLPNIVDAEEVRALAASGPSFALPGRFLLFVGKLEENKGVRLLVPAVAGARTGLPLVVLGEGTLAHALRFDATEAGLSLHLRGWTDREDVLRVLARATALVFPSLWPEPLSRVLLEAQALGTPVAAMDTGGTREIVRDGVDGLLVTGAERLSEAVGRLAGDERLRLRLAEGARASADRFSPASLVPRYEAVYRRLA
ncbi:MAG TPA: glycosyltransferase family 4 protein [Vicinamibacteria bacterium]|nr:glycosyltransferase family 4 protein [Vicinamibacteria bacterium]